MTSMYVKTDVGWVRIAEMNGPLLTRDDTGVLQNSVEYAAMWDLGRRLVDAGLCSEADSLASRYATTPGATIDKAPVIDGLSPTGAVHLDVLLASLHQIERNAA